MLSKSVTPGKREWDDRLPYVLFAYRTSTHASTGESPFLLLYGRDPKLPSELIESPAPEREYVDADDYKSVMIQEMNTAWDQARATISKAQKQQKRQHDKMAKNPTFKVGEQVFLSLPAMKTWPWRKLARPFKGPYQIQKLYPNGADISPVGGSQRRSLRVALNRLRRCPEELQGHEDPAASGTTRAPEEPAQEVAESPPNNLPPESDDSSEVDDPQDLPQAPVPKQDPPQTWKGCLRPRRKSD